MIDVHLMNGNEIVLNSDLIEFVEATPDTVVSLTNGKKLMVRESVQQVVESIFQFRQRLGARVPEMPDHLSVLENLPHDEEN